MGHNRTNGLECQGKNCGQTGHLYQTRQILLEMKLMRNGGYCKIFQHKIKTQKEVLGLNAE